MSDDLVITLIRALLVAPLTLCLGLPLARRLRRGGAVVWTLAVLPVLVPPLLTGYTFTNHHGVLAWPTAGRETFYGLLLVCRLLSPAAIVLALARPKISETSGFSLDLMAHAGLRVRMQAWLLGPGAGIGIAGMLVFLLAFLEFELASFFLVASWSVKLFDAQVGGQMLTTSLQQAGGPFFVAAILLGLMCWRLRVMHRLPDVEALTGKSGSIWPIIPALILLLAWPAFDLVLDSLKGVQPLIQEFSIINELLTSFGFALVAAWLATRIVAAEKSPLNLLLSALPGLFGALIIGLVLLRVFQLPFLQFAYDTPAPLLLGMLFSLMPAAVLLHLLAEGSGGSASFSTAMARNPHPIRWMLLHRRQLAVFLALFCLAWFELTLGSLLAPSGMTPVPARLYNFMHYGQSQVLSAMVLVSLLAPLLFIGSLYFGRRTWALRGR